MPKQYSDQLFRLIHSLSKSEKRAFKLYADRIGGSKEKKILRLFRRMDQQKIYDEARILRLEPHLLKIQMPNLKAHLYTQILQCLSSSPTLRSGEMKITGLLDQALLLYNKCLYDQCLRILDKAKRLARGYDYHVLLLEILELEKLALKLSVQEGNMEKANQLIQETDRTTESIRNINTFSNLALKLNSLYQHTGFIRNEQDYEKVRLFFESSLPHFQEERLSFHEKLYLYYSFTGYYFFIQDFKQGYKEAVKWVELFQHQPAMMYRKPELYIRALNSLLVAQNKLLLYDEFSETHKLLIGLKRDPEFPKTENINLNLFKTIYIHEINRHFMLGEFTAGTRIVRKLESELTDFLPLLDRHTVLIFFYKIACLYFGAGQFKTAIRWLGRIINEKEGLLREDLHAFARILRLISYFELGDAESVEYNIRSTYRFLRKKGELEKYFEIIINFLKASRHFTNEALLLDAFRQLKSEMELLQSSKFEKRAFLYFDMISWLESRIQKRPVEEVIKEKRQAGSK